MTREEALQVLIIKANKGAFVEDIINQIFDEHESQLKAKDEEIEKLRIVLVETQSDIVLAWSKLGKSTARSIVAMLFWEWRKKERRFVEEWNRNNMSIACAEFCVMSTNAEVVFGKAYAMLKDKQ